jgi:hypothetical protein
VVIGEFLVQYLIKITPKIGPKKQNLRGDIAAYYENVYYFESISFNNSCLVTVSFDFF